MWLTSLHWNLDIISWLSTVPVAAVLQPIGIGHTVGPAPCADMGLRCRLAPNCHRGQVLPSSWVAGRLTGAEAGSGRRIGRDATQREAPVSHGRASR
jgi:hypothetical protein